MSGEMSGYLYIVQISSAFQVGNFERSYFSPLRTIIEGDVSCLKGVPLWYDGEKLIVHCSAFLESELVL